MCKNFHFSIHIPGQLNLKEYNQVTLPRNLIIYFSWYECWWDFFCCCCCCCLFENIELNCDYWTKVIPQVFQSSHSIFFQKDWNIQYLACFFFSVLLNISTCWKYPQQYRKVFNNIEKLLYEKNLQEYSITILETSIVEMLVRKYIFFFFIFIPKLVQKGKRIPS